MKNIDFDKLLKEIRLGPIAFNTMPLGYTTGYPVLQVRNSKLCAIIPFLKYKVTGEVDKTLVYPIRYTITVELSTSAVVGFEDLSLDARFEKINFEKPVGYFRHESVKHLNKDEFKAHKKKLYALYGMVADAVIKGNEISEESEAEFANLLNIMLEPSLRPIYKALDRDFYDMYLA